MKQTIKISLITATIASLALSCEKEDTNTKSNITYNSVNKEYKVIKNVKELRTSNDEVSEHIDSILSGYINSEYVTTGEKEFDLDNDNISDLSFEIVDLNKFNPDGLPESYDTLAARVLPKNILILDNSTYGYPDALQEGEEISEKGFWSNKISVLGTFENAGQFQGKGERYLGIKFTKDNKIKYGWIKIECSEHNHILRIIDYAFNNIENSPIKAGQKN
jgi:hypothetical protein